MRRMFRNLFSRSRADRDLDAELRSHLDLLISEKTRAGHSPEDARRAALLELGGLEQVKLEVRSSRPGFWLDAFSQDLHFALRMLRKNPGFTAVAVLILALGIGANTAIFSVVNSVVLRPLPFHAPDRLVWVNGQFPLSDGAAVSPPDFVDYRAANHSYDRFAAMAGRAEPSSLSGDKPEQVLTTIVTAGFFDTLGIQPLLGRDFLPSDEQLEQPQVAILGYGIWRRRFGADRNIIGRSITLDGQSLTVVGVLPSDLPLLSEAQVWEPTPLLAIGMKIRLAHFLWGIARLKPGVTLAQSQADLDSISARLSTHYPDSNKSWSLRQRPLHEVLIGPVRLALMLIWAAVALLLLIAAANVANLLLSRSLARMKEFAVRSALGASRGRLFRQLLTESLVLAFAGAALGILAAGSGVQLLRAVGPADLPRLADVQLDSSVLIFTSAVALLTGLLSGLFPALQISRSGFQEGLKESAHATSSAKRRRLSGMLVVGEIAVSLALLAGAGLLLKSFWRLIHVNPGFQTTHVITARANLGGPAYRLAPPRIAFWRQVEERLSALPGFEAVGATSELPLSGEGGDRPFYLDGKTYGPSEFEDAQMREITPGYLSAMRIPLHEGRWFNQRDTLESAGVLLVNQTFADRFFSGQAVLGKRLRLEGDPLKTREIVGVVGNIHHYTLSQPQDAEMYAPYAQFPLPTMTLVIRASAAPEKLVPAIREVVAGIDGNEALSTFRSMDDVLDGSVAQSRFSTQLLGLFAALGLLLAGIGLYGLMAYSVTQRTNELGIRAALGATPGDILRLVLGQGARLALTGVAIGLLAAIPAARAIANLLYDVKPTDPVTFLGVAGLLTFVALLACYLPARRATRVDPVVALRYE
jgi:putative ABC transport system permease protein